MIELRAAFATLGLNEWVALISAAIAVASFLFNWAVVRRQTALQFEALRVEHDNALIAWADQVIEAMADAQAACRERGKLLSPDQFLAARSASRTRLSALLDRGRLFFPNMSLDAEGTDREAAFQGKRQPALDAVFQVYQIVTATERPEQASDDPVRAIVAAKRAFVSEVFNAIDPRRRQTVLKALDHKPKR